jgi:hypothetical protein
MGPSSTGSRSALDSLTRGCCRRAMDHSEHARHLEVDALFTLTVNLLWQLHYAAADQRVGWLQVDLVGAIMELEFGPWRHLGFTPDIQGAPFTVLCALLDVLLDELGRRTPGLSARVALARARGWLDPVHAG